MLSVDEILKYVTKYEDSNGFIKDEKGNRVTDQKIINEYNNVQNICNGIMNYKNLYKTDLSNDELLGLVVAQMNDLNISEKEYSESEINEKVKDAVEHALNKKKEDSQAKEVLDYVNNYYVLVNRGSTKGLRDPEVIKHYQDYCDSVKIYGEAITLKKLNGSDKDLEEIIEEVKDKINLTSDRKISLSVEEIKDYTYNYHYDLHHKKDDKIEQNADIINNYLKATDIYNKALELQKQAGADVSIEELIDEVLAREVPKKDEILDSNHDLFPLAEDTLFSEDPQEASLAPTEALASEDPQEATLAPTEASTSENSQEATLAPTEASASEDPQEATLAPTQNHNREQENNHQNSPQFQVRPERILDSDSRKVVERRLKHWQKKATKQSVLSFILRKANNHTKDYIKIYENIATVRAHFSVWTIEKIQASLDIIKADIDASKQITGKEKRVLLLNYIEMGNKLKNTNTFRTITGNTIEVSESLPDTHVKNVVAEPSVEAHDKPKEMVPDVEVAKSETDVERNIVKNRRLWSKRVEKKGFINFILRKSEKHSRDYKLILENILTLRSHFPYWTIPRIKECISIIHSDITKSKNLSIKEKSILNSNYRSLCFYAKVEEIDRFNHKSELKVNKSLPLAMFKRVVGDDSLDFYNIGSFNGMSNNGGNNSSQDDGETMEEAHSNEEELDGSNSRENTMEENEEKGQEKPEQENATLPEKDQEDDKDLHKDPQKPNKPGSPVDLRKEKNKPDSGENNKDEQEHKEPVTLDDPSSDNNPKGSSEEESEKNDKMHETIKNYYQSLLNELKSKQAPKITKEEYDSLSPDLQKQYQQLQLGRQVVVGSVESALIMYLQYFTTLGSENLENDFSPFSR